MKTALLYAPEEYWDLTPSQRHVVGGCGPGELGDKLIPDTIYFLSILQACRIHDFMYRIGASLEDKEEADRVFLNNMLRIIDSNTKYKWLKRLRRKRAHKYYWIVNTFGTPTFWKRKNKPNEMKVVGII